MVSPLVLTNRRASDQIAVCETLGVVEHGDNDRSDAKNADIRRSRHGQWQMFLGWIFQHEQAQGMLGFFRIGDESRTRRHR